MLGARAILGVNTIIPNVSYFTAVYGTQTNAGKIVQGSANGIFVDYNIGFADTIYITVPNWNIIQKITTDIKINTPSLYSGSIVAGNVAGSHSNPMDCVLDYNQNLFITEANANNIRKIAINTTSFETVGYAGSIIGNAGYVNGTNALFNSPKHMAVDSNNNIYVTDNNYVIRKISYNGLVTTLAGISAPANGAINTTKTFLDGLSTNARFLLPYGITVDLDDNIYVSDNNSIRKISLNGHTTTIAGHALGTAAGNVNGVGLNARFNSPQGLCCDFDGNIYVCDSGNRQIKKITKKIENTEANKFTILGTQIDGEHANSLFGVSLDMNSIGDRIIVGSSLNNKNGSASGAVYVYFWDGNNWNPLGFPIHSEAAGDRFGSSVAMNSVGDRIVVGAYLNDGNGTDSGSVRVFSWNGTAWVKIGQDIDGEAAGDLFGTSVAMNSVGDRIAIGAPGSILINNGSNSGSVRVFSWNGNNWVKMGQDIDGEAAGDSFGWSVSMNSVGDRIVVGAPNNDGNGTGSGSVRVFSWNESDWVQMGQDIDGEGLGDGFGTSVAINSVGDRIVVGAYLNDANGSNSGSVRVFSWNGSSWIKLGNDIDGEATGDYFGVSVTINSVGDRIVVGATNNRTGGTLAGSVRVFSWDGNAWNQTGLPFNGVSNSEAFGSSVAINSIGNIFASGARAGRSSNGTEFMGYVKSYGDSIPVTKYEVRTIAGAGTSGDSEGNYTTALFNSPRNIKMMQNGNLLVTDIGAYRIKKIKNTTGYKDTFNITLSSDRINLNLEKLLLRRGWDGKSSINCTLTILSGVYIHGDKYTTIYNTAYKSKPALTIGENLRNSTITIINSGGIIGTGGNSSYGLGTEVNGMNGGDAIYVRSNITLKNYGVIGGGGGGGGSWTVSTDNAAAGGGGGAGKIQGFGKTETDPYKIYGGTDGGLLSGGKGTEYVFYNQYKRKYFYYVGGDGGNLGQDGKLGSCKSSSDRINFTTYEVSNLTNPEGQGNTFYSGGIAGNAIDGISFITIDPSSTGSLSGATIN